MRVVLALSIVLIVVALFGVNPACADFGAPPGGPPGGGGPIGGGSETGAASTGTRSGSPSVNWGYAAAGTAACVAASAIFDSSVREDFSSLLVKGVVPCVAATGAVILVSLAGGPAALGVVVGIVVYGIIRWLISLFEEDRSERPDANRQTTRNFHDPFGECDYYSSNRFCPHGGR